MDIILMQDVESLGKMGETVHVARGYGRNYLIPKGIAVPATEGHQKMVMEHMKLETKRDNLRKTNAEELASSLGELSCTITVQAGDDDKLFGSVGVRDIAAALETDKVEITHQQIVIDEPIKQLGVYTVAAKLHSDVQVPVKVWVVKE